VFGARPGRVKQIIPIDLPRPRPFAIKRTAEFVAYVDQIWQLLEEEVFSSSGVARPQQMGSSGPAAARAVEARLS
jgi:hypothetical protein